MSDDTAPSPRDARHPQPVGAWALHRDPAGFTVRLPAAWRVRSGPPGELVVSETHGSAAAMVRARVVPAGVELADWLAGHYAATEPGLYAVRMREVEALGPQVACASFDYGSAVFQGCAVVAAVRHAEIATLFVAAAARERFDRRLPDLTRILDSVRYHATAVRLRLADPHDARPVEAVGQDRYLLPARWCRRRGCPAPAEPPGPLAEADLPALLQEAARSLAGGA